MQRGTSPRSNARTKQRKEEPPAKCARRAHRIADHIDPKYDNLPAIKFRDGFRSKSFKRHLSIKDPECKTTFKVIYRRFLDIDRFGWGKQNKERFGTFSSPDLSSESDSGGLVLYSGKVVRVRASGHKVRCHQDLPLGDPKDRTEVWMLSSFRWKGD